MNCLSRRAEIDVPLTPALPAPAFPKPAVPAVPTALLLHAALVVVVGEVVVGEVVVGETVGIIGTIGLGPSALTVGNTSGTGTAGVELTPRLPIS
jgi:hypothetical protein